MAYGAVAGDKWIVVVDGKEGVEYDSIMEGTPIFSADSQHLAYGAKSDHKWLVVVDGEEGGKYDGIMKGASIVKGVSIIFDSPDDLHYLAMKCKGIYLVEETMK